MNKGSMQTILITTLVFIGMMMLTKGCEKKEMPLESNVEAGVDSNTDEAFIADLTPNSAIVAKAAEYIGKAGERNAETGAVDFAYNNVVLSALNDSVTGYVVLDDSTRVSYHDVIYSTYPEGMVDSRKRAASKAVAAALDVASRNLQFGRHIAPNPDAPAVSLENDVIALEFSEKGGYISRATLKKYFTYFKSETDPKVTDTACVQVFNPSCNAYYGLNLRTADQQMVATQDLYFTPKQVNDSVVEMTLDLGNGSEWGFRYTLGSGSDYIIGMEIVQRNMEEILSASMNVAEMKWHQLMPRQDIGRTFEERYSNIYYKYVGDSPEDMDANKNISGKAGQLDHSIRWFGYKNQFFSTILIPRKPFEGAVVAQNVLKGDNPLEKQYSKNYLKDLDANLHLPYDNSQEVAAAMDIFIGPNLYPLLKGIDKQIGADDNLNLTRIIPLGWSWLRWINTLIVIPTFNFLGELITGPQRYGFIILILTILIKLILFPLTYKSYVSQAKMRVLAPQVKEINDKYPGNENAAIRQSKTMELYSSAGASPMAGCLPMMLQMPILIALFSFFPSCIELRGEHFLWASNLAAPDYICKLPFTIPFYGNQVSLFCLLMTVANIMYTYINMKSQPSSQSMPGMKWMMYLMPLMFLFFFNDYASALSYYYLLSLLITIGQTQIIRHFIDDKKLLAQMKENSKKPKKKKSGFMARLEEAQRRQQAVLREQQERERKQQRRR